MKIFVKIHPNSKTEKIIKKDDGSFDVRVKSQPVDGKANKALINILSEYFDIPKSLITIKAGHSVKNKIIEILD